MNNLEKKNIIVTGASGGIGNAIIKKLNEAGANILAKIFAPASFSFFMIALPIPPDAPVTIIFFFSKLFIFLNLQYLLGC